MRTSFMVQGLTYEEIEEAARELFFEIEPKPLVTINRKRVIDFLTGRWEVRIITSFEPKKHLTLSSALAKELQENKNEN